MAIGGPLRIDSIRSLPTYLTCNCFCFLCILLSPSLHTYLWIGGLCTSRLAEPTSYVDLTPQQDTNSFRAHDECNNHCPPTSLLLLLFHHHRHTDPPIQRSKPT